MCLGISSICLLPCLANGPAHLQRRAAHKANVIPARPTTEVDRRRTSPCLELVVSAVWLTPVFQPRSLHAKILLRLALPAACHVRRLMQRNSGTTSKDLDQEPVLRHLSVKDLETRFASGEHHEAQ